MRLAWVVLIIAVAVVVQADARFAASTGFSGRNVDCSVCHAPSAAPEATAHLDGVPETWRPGETYALEVSVTGGPQALPEPQPQGGFELEVLAGTLASGDGMEGLLRFPQPTDATYLPAGTLRRDWAVTWTAPGLHEPPVPIDLWLATVAANGNHIIATNTTDGGETGDAVATLHVTVPPDPDVRAAWEAMPLSPPVIDRIVETRNGFRIEGHHTDGNATGIGVRLFDEPWGDPAASGPDWVVISDAATLPHLSVRSAGFGRVSAPVQVEEAETPAPSLGAAALVAALLVAARIK